MASISNNIAKKPKLEGNGWRDEDFHSFWRHYELVQEWIRIEQEAREKSHKNWETQCFSAAVNNASAINTVHAATYSNLSTIAAASAADLTSRTTAMEVDEQEKPKIETQAVNELDMCLYTSSQNSMKKQTRNRKKEKSGGGGHSKQRTPSVPTEDESMDDEMKAFIRTTLEHRKQRDQKKRLEQQQRKREGLSAKGRRNSGGDDDYFDASNLSFKASQQQAASDVAKLELAKQARDFRRQHLYGPEEAARLDEMEAKVQAHFDAEFARHMPDTWPNIPIRF